ncbi:MAG TPA: precorrin-2 C(20)-methyltransferase [Methylocystis sp.]|nr:precorrin-2 C(20)-methyltransferase [Methylocystis sp.]
MSGAGALYGLGLGPGDPELVTVKAARLIGAATTVAYFAKQGRESHARRIAQSYLRPDCEELLLAYPMTTERPFYTPDYVEALRAFYAESAERVASVLAQGRDVALLCEGDPMFYGSFMHIFERLKSRFRVEICAGVSGMSGCFAAARQPMTWGDDVLAVIPATLDEEILAQRLGAADAAVVMKLGGNFPKLRRVLTRLEMIDRAIYVERGTMAEQKILPFSEKRDDKAPYFAMVLAPGRGRRP